MDSGKLGSQNTRDGGLTLYETINPPPLTDALRWLINHPAMRFSLLCGRLSRNQLFSANTVSVHNVSCSYRSRASRASASGDLWVEFAAGLTKEPSSQVSVSISLRSISQLYDFTVFNLDAFISTVSLTKAKKAGLQSLLPVPHSGDFRMPHLLLKLEDGVHQRFASRRTARNVDIHRHDSVTTSRHRVAVVIISTTVRATTHAYHPSWIWHLIVHLS